MPELKIQPSLSNDLRSQIFAGLVARLSTRLWGPLPPRGTLDLVDRRLPPRDAAGDVSVTRDELLALAPGVIDYSTLLPYLVDQVDDSIVPYLLWQFDVLGTAPTRLSQTPQPTFWQLLVPPGSPPQTLLKVAITLHTKRGLPRTLVDALLAAGWHVTLLEGQDAWGGTAWPPDQGWAVYRVIVDVSQIPTPVNVSPWDHARAYAPLDVVTYPRTTTTLRYFQAVVAPPIGIPPYYFLTGDVGRRIDDDGVIIPPGAKIGVFPALANVARLTTLYWKEIPIVDGVLQLTFQEDIKKIRAICEFFAPISRHLDSIIFNVTGGGTVVLAIEDTLELTDDAAPPDGVIVALEDGLNLSDTALAAVPGTGDSLSRIPVYDGTVLHDGSIDHSATTRALVDLPLPPA